jgi:ADP-ribose pyrophosphatase
MRSRVVKDELVYTGRICRVHKVGVRMDSGEVIDRDLVELANAVVIVPVLPDGSLVLIRNERFAVNEELLEFPAGKLDAPDEDPAEAARRELGEETGYTAGKVEPLGGFYTAPGSMTEWMMPFLATDLRPGPQRLEGYERIKVQTIRPERLAEMIAAGELHDGKSISAWALWQLRKGR